MDFDELEAEVIGDLVHPRHPINDQEISSEGAVSNHTDTGLPLVSSTQAQELRSLMTHAKIVARDFQALMATDQRYQLAVDGRPPTYEELLERLQNVLIHQQDVNQATSRLTSTNYFVNMVNYVRNKQLKYVVEAGRKELAETRLTVRQLEDNVEDLTTEVAVQQKISERIKTSLETTRTLLDTTITEYRNEMARQREILNQQNQRMSEIYKSRFNQDFILDASLFGTTFYLVNTFLFDYPVSMLVFLLASKGRGAQRRAAFLRQATKLLLIIGMMHKFRQLARYYGLHNQIGGVISYSTYFARLLAAASRSVVVSSQRILLPHSQSSESQEEL